MYLKQLKEARTTVLLNYCQSTKTGHERSTLHLILSMILQCNHNTDSNKNQSQLKLAIAVKSRTGYVFYQIAYNLGTLGHQRLYTRILVKKQFLMANGFQCRAHELRSNSSVKNYKLLQQINIKLEKVLAMNNVPILRL